MEQTPTRYGRYISILGLWNPEDGFEYALSQSDFKEQSYIEVMDWVAHKEAPGSGGSPKSVRRITRSSCPRLGQHPNLPWRLFRETFQNLSSAALDN
ncbi:MAG: hypothetical protein DCF21_00250 [Leptolyngbya sp.]|jgi:hypothetical protein|nr:MAG: hypothetical protein DCF21_00250 [Leptolyngbya sp.]